jgi:hypothetical protein
VRECQVCDNPSRPGLSTSQIEWHNLGHPGLVNAGPAIDPRKLRSMVIIRPGDQILYESQPGTWCRIDEIDVAIAAGRRVNSRSSHCARCFRLVLERRDPGPLGLLRSLIAKVALNGLRGAG